MPSDMPAQPVGKLFEPLQAGSVELGHRIALAPLTRFRAEDDHVHSEMAVEYYKQRGCVPGTLLITEGTFISPEAGGYANVPGIWSEAQVASWKRIVDAVHAQGSKIYLQLWALGRAATESVLKGELQAQGKVVSASACPLQNGDTPTPLTEDEIKMYVEHYGSAAKNFVHGAGGDGVEIHGANGYLIDQFLQTGSNEREDGYGGAVENRARFGLEVVDSVVSAVGDAGRVGIRLSPWGRFQEMGMSDAARDATFGYFVAQIKARHPDFSFIHLVLPRVAGNMDQEPQLGESIEMLYEMWRPKTILLAGGYTRERAIEDANKYENCVVVFGRHFISTPDLVKRIKHNVPLNDYNRDTFYKPKSPEGYIDQPFAPELKGKI